MILPKTDEGHLLTGIPFCFEQLNKRSKTDQALIQHVVSSVIEGMTMDLKTFGTSPETLAAFPTETDLKKYIQFVAGEPGRFWTGACLEHKKNISIINRAEWIHNGIQFGCGLQMVNILRDLPKDLQEGRCYIPLDRLTPLQLTPTDLLDKENTSRFLPLYHELIDDTIGLLRYGLEYIRILPRWDFRLKAAVWWPLVIGLKTLVILRGSSQILDSSRIEKISREDVYLSILTSLVVLPSHSALERIFARFAAQANSHL
jgi:farnesyl-diphosphate farnesyltransferase